MNYTETLKGKLLVGASSIFIITASLLGIFYNKNEKAKLENDRITLKADSLMAVKNDLQNELVVLTNQLADEKVLFQDLESSLDSKNAIIKTREAALKQVHDKLAMLEESKNSEINTLKTQIGELQSLKTTLEKSFAELRESDLATFNEKKDLQAKVLLLESQLREAKVDMKEIKYMASADNFRVEVLKPNTKITAKAKKAQTLRISMTIPEFLKTQETSNKPIYLTIADEKNNSIAGWNESVTVKDVNNNSLKIEVHNRKFVDFNKNPQKVSFDFTVENKLAPGLYTAKVYTNDSYLGTIEFRVRDSFWFF